MSSSKPTINTLPTELLFKILSYLPTYDVLHNVALVSKRFNESSQSPFVHKIVTLKEVEFESRDFLSKMTLTRELHIQQMTLAATMIIQLANYFLSSQTTLF